MRSKEGSKLVPNLCMGEEEGKGGDTGRFSLVLCRFSFILRRISLILYRTSLILCRILQFLVQIYSQLHRNMPQLFRKTFFGFLKTFFGFLKSYFTTFNHFHAAICFIQCQTTSPFIWLSPQPQSEHIIYYRSISFDIPPSPAVFPHSQALD